MSNNNKLKKNVRKWKMEIMKNRKMLMKSNIKVTLKGTFNKIILKERRMKT